jgi:hypothetical protein
MAGKIVANLSVTGENTGYKNWYAIQVWPYFYPKVGHPLPLYNKQQSYDVQNAQCLSH